ncbi:hypothetical protein ACJ41O_014902 [Fusarium nematophilum]
MSEQSNLAAEQVEMSNEEVHQQRLSELDKADESPNIDIALLFETLTHCAEPADAEALLAKLSGGDAGAETTFSGTSSLENKERGAALREHSEGTYRVKFDGRSYPERHHTWPEAFQLHVDDKNEFFVVLQSQDAQPKDDDNVYPTNFAKNDPKTRVAQFGYRYACGERARDENNNLIGEENDQIEFNYAEHKMMGEMLRLRWSGTETTPGTRELQLPNGIKLSYGEINGLGGDFFGGYSPVSDGKSLEQQCKYFKEAFDTLGKSDGAKKKAQDLLNRRQEEVDAIAQAVAGGQSTFEAYNRLKHPAFFGLSTDDVGDQLDSAFSDGPSYLRLAQINLDHFGQDAITAYNAGHYCALEAAAGGNLELGYAMNAFADHYLGDCFASGHFRTPRRTLHGSTTGFQMAWAVISGMLQNGPSGADVLAGALKPMAPDLLSMLMHNEDNKLGITVKNRKGTKFTIWGDKQLFEAKNARNKEMMRQALQASVDEVYEAFESKVAKPPGGEPGYRAWLYAPSQVVESASHSPLFVTYDLSFWEKVKLYWPVKVRDPFWDPNAKSYRPIGGTPSLIKLYNDISSSDQWKKY